MILREIDTLDRAIIALYEPFDIPADQLILDDDGLSWFCDAIIRLTAINVRRCSEESHGDRGYTVMEFKKIVQCRLLFLRRRAADRRRQRLPALAKLGRNWKGPNRLALRDKVELLKTLAISKGRDMGGAHIAC